MLSGKIWGVPDTRYLALIQTKYPAVQTEWIYHLVSPLAVHFETCVSVDGEVLKNRTLKINLESMTGSLT